MTRATCVWAQNPQLADGSHVPHIGFGTNSTNRVSKFQVKKIFFYLLLQRAVISMEYSQKLYINLNSNLSCLLYMSIQLR